MEMEAGATKTEGLSIDELVRVVDQMNAGQQQAAAPELDIDRTAFHAWVREEDRRGRDFALCW